ncbi:DNA helicase UvrD [Enemella dayhoffiae]|uniref:DNA 3'-5' helicase n=1 Tax=Enemella dayhoffiae TaxID=2016507 RepID=A0A255GUP0_9ACTN|nr:ATP-dependent DNA helicase [Enemella dayhoffiae]OYO19388.1 DNA helicase UvrD [Enemella dayhoffiae]
MAGIGLRRRSVEVAVPRLDGDQQRVVEHPGGPLLVLAGPGTGKTTTLVEAVVARLQSGRTPLVLTFSRRAAADLRERITARLGRSTATPTAMTFHSFCHAMLRRFGAAAGETGGDLRLLTAPEQEFRVRETLAGLADRDPELTGWPNEVRAAYPTRAFAAEVRQVLARARQLGLDPEDLVAAAEQSGRPEWAAVGGFMEEYLEVLDFEQVLDYSELVHRCRILLTDPEVLATLRREFDGLYVDEYQDTDPSQVDLLADLVGPGGDIVAVGDPDQSIYGFRGAEARGILDFPDRFRTADGAPAPVVALGTTRRFGPRIADATRHLAERLPLARSLPAPVRERFRQPVAAGSAPGGRVDVLTFESTGAEAEHIADLLRQAHLNEGIGWAEMAVLVRSGRRNLPPLVRALSAAGVPVEVAGDEIALSAEPAVRPLLLALQVALRPGAPDADEAARLLVSPLGGLDSLGLRRLGRRLRESERLELGGAMPESSAELCRLALGDPGRFDDCERALGPTTELERARELALLLAAARTRIESGGTAEEVLWLLWSGTRWPARLRADSFAGGDPARRADRDLDAVCALFDIAARSEELIGVRGVESFMAEVEAQQIPADTNRESDVGGRGVRLLTAHRAKGLQWRLVVVASVQEGGWPDLRVRGSLLQADRLGRLGGGVGLSEGLSLSERLAEERRLFYVACTRARQRLYVTAVEGTEGEGDQPSRFLSELRVPVQPITGRPRRPLTLAALVGELRRVAVDPEQPTSLRDAAAVRLAWLADASDESGGPLVPAADPARWWGMRDTSRADAPVVPADEPVQLSGSALGSLLSCPREWFLSRRAQGESGRHSAATAGEVLHLLVDHAARHEVSTEELVEHLDEVWQQLDFDAHYLSAVERVEAEAMVQRYAAWESAQQRELLGTEVGFRLQVEVDGAPVLLTGSVDRLERIADGRLHVVDFKTGRSEPDRREVPSHEQLGVYQLAAQQGAFDRLTGGERRVSGAELVYLRLQERGDLLYPKVFVQASLDDQPHLEGDDPDQPTWVHDRISRAARMIRTEDFQARVGKSCRYCSFVSSCPAQGAQVVE